MQVLGVRMPDGLLPASNQQDTLTDQSATCKATCMLHLEHGVHTLQGKAQVHVEFHVVFHRLSAKVMALDARCMERWALNPVDRQAMLSAPHIAQMIRAAVLEGLRAGAQVSC